MSVTLIQAPAQYTQGYNEQLFLASGTTAGKNDYKFIFNIYDSTGVTRLVPSIKIPPRVSDSWAAFDAGRIIESYLASDIAILGAGSEGFKTNDNSFYAYTVKVGDEYDVSTTGVTSYPDLVSTSGVIYAWNAALSFQDNQNFHVTDYLVNTTSSKFLTNHPKLLNNQYDLFNHTNSKPINMDENEWRYAMINTGANAYELTVSNSNGDTFRINNPYSTLSSSNRRFIRFPVGTRNLNRIPSSAITVAVGSLPIIKASTQYYRVYLSPNTYPTVGAGYGFIIPENLYGCTNDKYDKYRLHWLNQLGGFDSFTFNMLSRTNATIERKQYKKLYGATSGRWSYNTYDRGVINYNTSITDKLTLNSDWLTEQQSEFLESLVTSPEIYWDNDDELQAINITNSSYEKRKTINDKVFNLTLEIEIGQKRFTQRF